MNASAQIKGTSQLTISSFYFSFYSKQKTIITNKLIEGGTYEVMEKLF